MQEPKEIPPGEGSPEGNGTRDENTTPHIATPTPPLQPTVELDEAARFLACLDPDAKFSFQTFDDVMIPDAEGKPVPRKDPKLVKVLHGTLAQHAKTLAALNARGAGVFVTVNETDGKGRKAENVARVRALFVDLDGAPLEPVLGFTPPPHIVVQSSPDRWHCYWRVKDLPLDQFTKMQKPLIAQFGADPAVHDLPRVMRLPGFVHRKGEPFASHIVSVREGVCAAADFPTSAPPSNVVDFLRKNAGKGLSNNPGDFFPPEPVDRAKIEAALAVIPPGEPKIYDDWVRIGGAIYHELGDAGREVFVAWSDRSTVAGHKGAAATKWPECMKFTAVRAGTIFMLADARDPSWRAAVPAPAAETKVDVSGIRWHGDAPLPEPSWLIKTLLPETGVALLAGQWGIYKTFVALDLAGAVMTGEPFAGQPCKRRGGALLVAAEGADQVAIRLAGLSEAKFGGRKLPFAWVDTCPPLRTQGSKVLIAQAKVAAARLRAEHGLPLVLVIVDTVIAAADFENENSASQGQIVMNALRDLSRATGALVLGVDHYGKDAETGTRGTSAKEGSADAILAVLGNRSETGKITNARMVARKVRSGVSGIETPIRVQVVDLGVDSDHESITTLAIHWGAPGEVQAKPAKVLKSRGLLADAVKAAGGLPAPYEKVQAAFAKAHGGGASAVRMAFKRAVSDAGYKFEGEMLVEVV